MGERKKQILFGAIDNYIKQASPITSLLVHRTDMIDLSTATLRNELSALEAMGYLKQLHTSSGRVPTTKGYRFFVNEIVHNLDYSMRDLKKVKEELFLKTGNLMEIVQSITEAVSKSTKYPAVVVLDGFKNLKVQSIKVMYLLSHQVLVLIETNAGVITNTLSASDKVTMHDCENASAIFTDIFEGKKLGYLMQHVSSFNEQIKKAMKEYEEIFKLVLCVLENYNSKDKVSSGGMLKLLDSPEYSDSKKAREILNILDDKQQLKDIFDTTDSEGISIKIGSENQNSALDECAVIKAPIVIDGNKIASVGIIGPQRIDYASVASVLKFIADQIKDGRTGKKD
ncbi:MAG: heat-inducible transcriptional repressor HrcA [Christensenellaceae bacterium]|nr:heat-inducible transcriptional repressor HrcA [Christensenellaceae bacterium]